MVPGVNFEIVQMGRVLSQQGTVSAWAVDLGDVSLNGLRTTEPSDPNDLRIGDVRLTPKLSLQLADPTDKRCLPCIQEIRQLERDKEQLRKRMAEEKQRYTEVPACDSHRYLP